MRPRIYSSVSWWSENRGWTLILNIVELTYWFTLPVWLKCLFDICSKIWFQKKSYVFVWLTLSQVWVWAWVKNSFSHILQEVLFCLALFHTKHLIFTWSPCLILIKLISYYPLPKVYLACFYKVTPNIGEAIPVKLRDVINDGSSRSQMFFQMVLLKILQYSRENHCVAVSF